MPNTPPEQSSSSSLEQIRRVKPTVSNVDFGFRYVPVDHCFVDDKKICIKSIGLRLNIVKHCCEMVSRLYFMSGVSKRSTQCADSFLKANIFTTGGLYRILIGLPSCIYKRIYLWVRHSFAAKKCDSHFFRFTTFSLTKTRQPARHPTTLPTSLALKAHKSRGNQKS